MSDTTHKYSDSFQLNGFILEDPVKLLYSDITFFYFQKSTYFILGDLLPSSLYFIQVQAVTVPYGLKKKLVSGQAAVFIDTNMYINGEL